MRSSASLPLSALLFSGCAQEPTTTDYVGDAVFCEDVETWPTEASNAEYALLEAVNEARRGGATCGETLRSPTLSVRLEPPLRCASRVHASDLSRTGQLSHTGSDGSNPLERMGAAGYEGFPRHELLAGDFVDPRQVVAAWMEHPDHCEAIMDTSIEHAGPGAHESDKGDNIAWVLTTGEPRPE